MSTPKGIKSSEDNENHVSFSEKLAMFQNMCNNQSPATLNQNDSSFNKKSVVSSEQQKPISIKDKIQKIQNNSSSIPEKKQISPVSFNNQAYFEKPAYEWQQRNTKTIVEKANEFQNGFNNKNDKVQETEQRTSFSLPQKQKKCSYTNQLDSSPSKTQNSSYKNQNSNEKSNVALNNSSPKHNTVLERAILFQNGINDKQTDNNYFPAKRNIPNLASGEQQKTKDIQSPKIVQNNSYQKNIFGEDKSLIKQPECMSLKDKIVLYQKEYEKSQLSSQNKKSDKKKDDFNNKNTNYSYQKNKSEDINYNKSDSYTLKTEDSKEEEVFSIPIETKQDLITPMKAYKKMPNKSDVNEIIDFLDINLDNEPKVLERKNSIRKTLLENTTIINKMQCIVLKNSFVLFLKSTILEIIKNNRDACPLNMIPKVYMKIISNMKNEMENAASFIDDYYEIKMDEIVHEEDINDEDEMNANSTIYVMSEKESYKEIEIQIDCEDDLNLEIPQDF
ncbi:hypothetical protein M9Y10_010307 [Tritrichomonas musculus]|uniref:Uncharacterized protein n=1 Tax=Tritrichomonas musculus TaxID=1915356 RepID=A0ABR2ILN9_9EUKA